MRSRVALLSFCLILTGCSAFGRYFAPSISQPTSVPSAPPTAVGGIELARSDLPRLAGVDPRPAATAMNAFGVDLYARLATADGNFVFSPASIQLALAMLRPGARGETADQMDQVMHGVGADGLAAAISSLQAALDARSGTYKDVEGKDVQLTLRIANSAFGQRGLAIEQPFLNALSSRFDTGVRLVDYVNDPEGARRLINGWVSDQTEQRIPDLLAPGTIDELTRLVLANAIYLKAPWQTQFARDATSAGSFTRPDGSTVQVPLMHLQESFAYAEGSGWQAVDLPYVGGSLSMTVILPTDLDAFERSMTEAQLERILGALAPREVQLAMPSFATESKTDLSAQLSALGMPLAFDPNEADFSGITSDQQLYVSHVVHQANITVNEAGTEAAAATAVVVGATGLPSDIARMTVDRPFLFAVRDGQTGAVLFLGRIEDPSISG